MASPIRRLSTVLRLSRNATPAASPVAAAAPAESPVAKTTVAPAQPVQQFLSSAKERYLRDIAESPTKGAEWTVVMGNEAGGKLLLSSKSGYF